MTGDPLFYIVVAAVLVVLAILGYGIFGFGAGRDSKKANKIMQWRIIAQAVAVALILLFVYLRSQGTDAG